VIKAVFLVLAAAGELGPDEQDVLNDLAEALNLSRAHFRGILAELDA
jgi:DnaJ-domain-containing protein 1